MHLKIQVNSKMNFAKISREFLETGLSTFISRMKEISNQNAKIKSKSNRKREKIERERKRKDRKEKKKLKKEENFSFGESEGNRFQPQFIYRFQKVIVQLA